MLGKVPGDPTGTGKVAADPPGAGKSTQKSNWCWKSTQRSTWCWEKYPEIQCFSIQSWLCSVQGESLDFYEENAHLLHLKSP